jgi:hypothetical protein
MGELAPWFELKGTSINKKTRAPYGLDFERLQILVLLPAFS